MSDAAGQSFEKPHVRAGARQLNMPQPLSSHFGQRHFHAALIADHSAMLHPLVFAAKTLPVRHRSENLGTKQTIALRLKGSIIKECRFGALSMRTGTNLLGRCEADFDAVKIRGHIAAVIRVLSKQGQPPWEERVEIIKK